jgi:CRISPR-associated protein Cas2
MSEPIQRLLVAYDIADDRRRDKVAVALQEHGERVQYSVFLVDGRPATFVRLQMKLRSLIDPAVDTVMFCNLGPRDTRALRAVTHIGAQRHFTSGSPALIA